MGSSNGMCPRITKQRPAMFTNRIALAVVAALSLAAASTSRYESACERRSKNVHPENTEQLLHGLP